eukprot:6313161-Pyramimonas_sp.AAC.1
MAHAYTKAAERSHIEDILEHEGQVVSHPQQLVDLRKGASRPSRRAEHMCSASASGGGLGQDEGRPCHAAARAGANPALASLVEGSGPPGAANASHARGQRFRLLQPCRESRQRCCREGI